MEGSIEPFWGGRRFQGTISKLSDLQGVFVKIGDFMKFKGFSVEFLESRRSSEKQKTPRKSLDKWTFLSLAFYNAPSLHTVDKSAKNHSGARRERPIVCNKSNFGDLQKGSAERGFPDLF